jgi:Zn-dependent protease with chaperone function
MVLAIRISFAHSVGCSLVRIFVAALFVFFWNMALAQTSFDRPPISDNRIRHYCEADRVSSGAEVELVAAIAHRLGNDNPRITIAVSNSLLVNAWEVDVPTDSSLICVPEGLVYLMRRRLAALGDEHPITADRIHRIHKLIAHQRREIPKP